MAAEYFLYTTLYSNTLVNRSNTSFAPLPPDTGEIEIDYFIPVIQPLYYYRESGATIVLNSEANINEYLKGTAPPPEPDDNVLTYTFTGYTGTTDTRLNGMDVDISGNTTGVTANTAAINVSNELIVINYDLITGNTAQINASNELIVINYDLITGNTTGITTNKADISLLADEVAINITDIADNATGITNNSAAISVNAGNVTYISGVTDTKHNISDFNSYSASTDTRLDGIDLDVSYISGVTDTKTDNDVFIDYTATTKTKLKDKINTVTGATNNLGVFLADGNLADSGVSIDTITGGTGHYYYTQKIIQQNTTSNSDVIFLSGKSGTLEGGTWSIDFNAIGGNSGPNKSIVVGFYIDDNLQGAELRFKTNDAAVVIPFVITKDLTLTAGTHDFEIRFRRVGGGTAFIKYGSIRARIVN